MQNRRKAFSLVWILLFLAFGRPALAQHGPLEEGQQRAESASPSGRSPKTAPAGAMSPDMHDMNPVNQGEHAWCEDTVWSSFNHRVAGWFLFLWGLTALIAGLRWGRGAWWRFVPPLVLFGFAEFLFFRNDPETWPVGPVSFWASLHNAEDLQHRIFLVLIILMGVVELLRAADRLRPFFAKYSLPGLAVLGSIYLFFHHHNGESLMQMWTQPKDSSMTASPAMQQAMASMILVMHEHMWFSFLGFGLAAAKLLADTGRLKGRWGAALWTLFAIVLGIYMTGYTE